MLGSVAAWDGDRQLDIGHSRQRCLLAVLLLELNRVVPIDTVIDRLWGEQAPASARNVVYGHVTRLRTALTAAGGRSS